MVGGESADHGAVPERMVGVLWLNTRRGDDMDSLYNVVKSFTGWRGFDTDLGFWQPPSRCSTPCPRCFSYRVASQSHTLR